MDKNVIVSLKGIQTGLDNQTTTLEMMSEAKFYKKDNTYYIVYEETEITGMEGTKTTIKISGDVVNLIRFGTISSNMIFEKGIKHSCSYGTSYGSIDVSVEAKDMKIKIDDDGGEIYIGYDVEIAGEGSGYNNFYLKIFEGPSK